MVICNSTREHSQVALPVARVVMVSSEDPADDTRESGNSESRSGTGTCRGFRVFDT